jgi:hypothetical protein
MAGNQNNSCAYFSSSCHWMFVLVVREVMFVLLFKPYHLTLFIMAEKQPLKNGEPVAEDQCSTNACSNCYTYRGCMHQPYSFWQALCDAAAFQLQPSEELKARIFKSGNQSFAA